MAERAHTPTCEVNRGGDHGPCSCGRDADARRERSASDAIIELVDAYGSACHAHDEQKQARLWKEIAAAVIALSRQRHKLAGAARHAIDCCEMHEPCGTCSRLRAALEVR